MSHEPLLDQMKNDDQASQPAVAVDVGVEGLELKMTDRDPGQKGEIGPVDPPFPVGKQIWEVVVRGRHQCGVGDPALRWADPVLGSRSAPMA